MSPPRRDNARRQPGAEGEQAHQVSLDCAPTAAPPQTLRLVEGERKAGAYLARLHAGQADPDELALILAKLYGDMLRGFCAAIVRALEGRL